LRSLKKFVVQTKNQKPELILKVVQALDLPFAFRFGESKMLLCFYIADDSASMNFQSSQSNFQAFYNLNVRHTQRVFAKSSSRFGGVA
jgi:hypothetical protein